MITLPANFDVVALVGDFFSLAAPFVGIGFLIGGGYLILTILRNG